jgi:hypothetical protein
MRALFRSTILLSKIGHFSWMAGWGAWFVTVTWSLAFGGSFWIPFTNEGLTANYGNLLFGFLMLGFGMPLGLAAAHFVSVVLRLPGALICSAVAQRPGNEDLLAIVRR